MESTKHIYVGKLWVVAYGIMGVVLIPWIFDLAQNLPSKHEASHWDALWVGFDAMMVAMIALTIYFAMRKQLWVVITTSALATLFVVDAWFDILTSKPGHEQRIALFFGAIEVALAVLTFKLVHHVVKHATPHDKIKVVPKPKS